MNFRESSILDLEDLFNLIGQAKVFLRENKVDQWQNGYPYESDIKRDIENKSSYVITNNEKVVGTVSISLDGECTYEKIYDGNWITKDKYIVMHRVAIDTEFRGKGIFSRILEEVEKFAINSGVFSIKVDTHEDNIIMQKTLIKNDFKRCGIIYLEDGSKRIAFEKNIKN